MTERILSVVVVALWTLIGMLSNWRPIWFGGIVGGLVGGLPVALYWLDRSEREAAGRT